MSIKKESGKASNNNGKKEKGMVESYQVHLKQNSKSTPLEVEYQEIQTLLAELSEIQLRGTRFFSGVVP